MTALLPTEAHCGPAANATGPIVLQNETVTLKYVVTNTGDVPLANVTLTGDALLGTVTIPQLVNGVPQEFFSTAQAFVRVL